MLTIVLARLPAIKAPVMPQEKSPIRAVLSADSKRQKGQEILKDSYLTQQAMSFADRKAEQRLQEAQRVCCCLLLQSLTVLLP